MMNMIVGGGTSFGESVMSTVEQENLEEEKKEGILVEKNGVKGNTY